MEREHRRRIAYSLAASAVAITGSPDEAAAEIVWSGVANLDIAPAGFQTLQFDYDPIPPNPFDLVLKNYVDPYGQTGYFQGVFSPSGGTGFVGFKAGLANRTYATLLNEGFEVNPTNTGQGHFTGSLAFGTNHPNAQFNNAVEKFIGFSFATVDGDPRFHMGWVRVTIDNANHLFTIHDWAWERALGVPIITGDTGIVEGVPGDFDGDDDVDGRDFLLWQRGSSPASLSPDDLADWQDNYGTVPPLVATAVVPEAATLGLLAAGGIGLSLLRRLRGW